MGKQVSVCGEMAGDTGDDAPAAGPGPAQLLMHPAQRLSVKQEVLRADAASCSRGRRRCWQADSPAELLPGAVSAAQAWPRAPIKAGFATVN